MTRRHTLVILAIILLGSAQVAQAQLDWTVHQLVVPPGNTGAWDSGGHMLGDVAFDGTYYHLYLGGGPGDQPIGYPWAVGHWWSTDVTGPWAADASPNPVLVPEPGKWDAHSIIGLGVHFDGAMFHGWYAAPEAPLGPPYVGYATNPTGFGDWTKVGPVAGLDPGPMLGWDGWGRFSPAVLVDGGTHHMWFTAIDPQGGTWGTWSIGHARSTDGGLTWVKDPDDAPVLDRGEPGAWDSTAVYNPEVVPYGHGFAMWYVGHDGTTARVGWAVSHDGITWTKRNDNPVLGPWELTCYRLDSIAVLVDSDTIHGWISQCNDIYYVTSSYEVFSDGFETGGTGAWSLWVP